MKLALLSYRVSIIIRLCLYSSRFITTWHFLSVSASTSVFKLSHHLSSLWSKSSSRANHFKFPHIHFSSLLLPGRQWKPGSGSLALNCLLFTDIETRSEPIMSCAGKQRGTQPHQAHLLNTVLIKMQKDLNLKKFSFAGECSGLPVDWAVTKVENLQECSNNNWQILASRTKSKEWFTNQVRATLQVVVKSVQLAVCFSSSPRKILLNSSDSVSRMIFTAESLSARLPHCWPRLVFMATPEWSRVVVLDAPWAAGRLW